MRLVIAGSRTFEDYDRLKVVVDKLLANTTETITILCGEANGADALGKRYAQEHNYAVESFPADWKRQGRQAGYKRNVRMINTATHAIFFWDGISNGTRHAIGIAWKNRIPYRVITF